MKRLTLFWVFYYLLLVRKNIAKIIEVLNGKFISTAVSRKVVRWKRQAHATRPKSSLGVFITILHIGVLEIYKFIFLQSEVLGIIRFFIDKAIFQWLFCH